MENISREEALRLLNAENRLENLQRLVQEAQDGKLPLPVKGEDVNNHIHTSYSFSPYSPTAAVWFSWQAGLCTCGLMDHDSIGGADEFLKACHIAGIHGTIGMEYRVSMRGTPFADRRFNCPDQLGLSYLTMHGVPHDRAAALNDSYAPYREKRNARNRKMVESVNALLSGYGIAIDFDRDVLPLSNYAVGGTVTERHLSSALAIKMMEKFGSGAALARFIKETLKLPLSGKVEGYLVDENNPFRMYDLLGWIKAQLIGRFYIDATEELPSLDEGLKIAREAGAIISYPYLGDVGDSVTGDKKAQKFEDDFLDELFPFLKDTGFQAISYMPSRNTPAQMQRLRALCEKYDMLQISGEDINQPRQQFVCMAQRAPEFRGLYDAAWALIGHEWLSTGSPEWNFFSKECVEKWPKLNDRIRVFAEMARALKP